MITKNGYNNFIILFKPSQGRLSLEIGYAEVGYEGFRCTGVKQK